MHIVKDGEYVYSIEPGKQNVEFTWRDTQPDKGEDQLLLRPRRAEGRATGLGEPDVDYL